MPLDSTQRQEAARALSKEMFSKPNVTATLDLSDLVAAIGSIDDDLHSLPSPGPPSTVRANVHANLPVPFKTTATDNQKDMAVAFAAMKLAGLI